VFNFQVNIGIVSKCLHGNVTVLFMKSPLPKSCSFHVLCNSTDIRFYVKKCMFCIINL